MDISLREWLIIGGILIVVLILIDGWRRVSANRNRLRLEIDRTISELGESDQQNNPELPNGGARRRNSDEIPQVGDLDVAKPKPARPSVAPQARREPVFSEPAEPRSTAPAAVQAELSEMDPLFDDIPADVELNRARPARSRKKAAVDSESVAAPIQQTMVDDPELMRAVEHGELQGGSLDLEPVDDSVPGSVLGSGQQDHEYLDDRTELDFEQPIPTLFDKVLSPDAASLPDDTLAAYKHALDLRTSEATGTAPAKQDPLAGLTATELPAEPTEYLFGSTELGLDEEIPDTAMAAPEPEPESEAPDKPKPGLRSSPDPEHVLVITVVGRNRQLLPGPALHMIVTACGMEWGDMSIYHRTEEDTPGAPVQFSMANAVPPGTFDPKHLETLETPAVSFFMSMSEPDDPINAYECMLATAETLAKHLDGDLLDEDRSVMRPQTKEHYRERIREFEMHNRTRRVH